MKRFSIRYALLTYRLDQFWLPLSIWILFAVVCLIERGLAQQTYAVRGYLGTAIPLIAGIMSAYAVLDDPALELRFATPISAAQTLLERMAVTFLIQATTAVTFQVFAWLTGADLSMYPSIWHLQLAWIIPTLSLMSLGSACAMIARQPTTGALMVGLVWIVELVARGWLAANNGRYVLVFMGALLPDHPDLLANQLVLAGLCLALFLTAWELLRRQERYL